MKKKKENNIFHFPIRKAKEKTGGKLIKNYFHKRNPTHKWRDTPRRKEKSADENLTFLFNFPTSSSSSSAPIYEGKRSITNCSNKRDAENTIRILFEKDFLE